MKTFEIRTVFGISLHFIAYKFMILKQNDRRNLVCICLSTSSPRNIAGAENTITITTKDACTLGIIGSSKPFFERFFRKQKRFTSKQEKHKEK
jgi:hypothetical protein